MKRYTLLIFLFLTMLAAAVRAEVVVYKGTLRIKLDAGDALNYPALVRLYFIVDYSTGESARVIYWVKNGKHLQKSNQAMNVSTGTLPNAKPITILAAGQATNTAVSDFYYTFNIIRGVNAVLKVESEPGTSTLVRPRILTGYGAYTAADDASDGRFQEGTYNLVFNSALTLDANNADKSLATMRDEIAGRLAAQGYED
jgi:hypothetical protein